MFSIENVCIALLGPPNPNKSLPLLTSQLVSELRWSLNLAADGYIREYKQGKQFINVDVFSRLLQNIIEFNVSSPADVVLFVTTPVTQIGAKLLTSSLEKILIYYSFTVDFKWKASKSHWCITFQPYLCCRHEIILHQDCVLWKIGVTIPRCLRKSGSFPIPYGTAWHRGV